MKKIIVIIILNLIVISVAVMLAWNSKTIEVKSEYSNEDFGIETYISNADKDNDGIDDQTDILNNVKKYIETKPKYESKYYSTGYPDDNYGVCTDVVAFGLKDAGYDLMELVNSDIKLNPKNYNIDKIDKNIDFRRVRNLEVYFRNNAISLTTNLDEIDKWQGGDIIVFNEHIGIISDKRNEKGIPYLIHHRSVDQKHYEEDILEFLVKECGQDYIIGHYRIS